MSAESMTEQQRVLYERIVNFVIDDEGSALSFADRLASENGWTAEFAQRAILEYKKFIFLAMEAGHAVTPSDEVDQVWHLHLTYSKSYWDRFCNEVLQRPLHHCPTTGGGTEQEKFRQQYQATLDSYKKFFGKAPAKDLWPKVALRFRYGLDFVRVNSRRMWIISKRQVYWKAALVLSAMLFLAIVIYKIKQGLQSAEDSLQSWLVDHALAIVLVCGVLLVLALNIKWSLMGDKSKRRKREGGGCSDGDADIGDGGDGGCGGGGCGD
ncbi:MAG: hypothetical protein L3J39_01880 [Verrucomicrobiales bacterium]|nr:hypothetical protein [Verrucomicrobiales bacterium]